MMAIRQVCDQHEGVMKAITKMNVKTWITVVSLPTLITLLTGFYFRLDEAKLDRETYEAGKDVVDEKMVKLERAYDLLQRIDERQQKIQRDLELLNKSRVTEGE